MVNNKFEQDIAAIAELSAVPAILEVICASTGMGFAAIARVTEDTWISCAVLDKVEFGLKSGDELSIEATFCNEIRQNHKPIVMDDARIDVFYSKHHIPVMYGFRSYISVPIILEDGSFFGTLCALDREPAKVDNRQTRLTFELFANLIAMQLVAFWRTQELLDKLDSASSQM